MLRLVPMSEQSEQLKERTMRFAVGILSLVDKLTRSAASDIIGRQLGKKRDLGGGKLSRNLQCQVAS